MVRLRSTRNESLVCGMTSTIVLVVGQNSRLRRLKFSVRAPGRSGPNCRIQRHCGLHCGIRRKSDINSQTFEGGASISIEACSSGATIRPPGLSCTSLRVEKVFESVLCAARAPTGGGKLPPEDARPQQTNP